MERGSRRGDSVTPLLPVDDNETAEHTNTKRQKEEKQRRGSTPSGPDTERALSTKHTSKRERGGRGEGEAKPTTTHTADPCNPNSTEDGRKDLQRRTDPLPNVKQQERKKKKRKRESKKKKKRKRKKDESEMTFEG